jgi:sporulation protein YlmC with PRC-barrel domain
MAEFELKVKDIEGGELEVTFNAEGLGKVSDISTNTAAQNLAIMLLQEMQKVDINLTKAMLDRLN